MLTGKRDYSDGGLTKVETAHIIPEATNKRIIGQEGEKHFDSGGVWTVLWMFTDVNIVEELAGKLIHRLENIISMDLVSHWAFDELILWLKPVEGSPHTYRVCEARQGLKTTMRLPDIVTLSKATEYPLPNPAYLALHALSGVAEYLMDVERRMEETMVLATDGSTARALALV